MNPSKILDSIGRILTPIFAIMIVVVIVAGAFKYGGHNPQDASQAYQASAFGKGFLEGYNTLDALASVAFSVVAVVTLNQLGFKSKKEYISTIWVVGFVVTLLFGALYLGLAFWGIISHSKWQDYQKMPILVQVSCHKPHKPSLDQRLRFS